MKDYQPYCKLIILMIAVMAFALPRIGFPASSENYRISEEVLGAGGGEMNSPNFTVLSTHSQAISGIEMKSENFNVSGGFVAAALPTLEAAIDIDPDTLNLRSGGKWITCYMTLPEGYPKDVFDPTAVALTMVNGETLDSFIFSDHPKGYEDDDILKVKFIRAEVQGVVPLGDEVELTVTGNLLNGATFQGTGLIRVIDPGERKGNLQEEKTKSSQKGK